MAHSQTGLLLANRLRELRGGLSRRQFLRSATGTTAAVLIAGCLGDDDQPTDDEPAPDAPDSFDDRAELRSLTREYVRLLADGEFDRAAGWLDEETAARFGATDLERAWRSVVGRNATLETIDSLVYFGTETGNNLYRMRATVDGDRYQFLVGFSEGGVNSFTISPIEEWTPPEYVDQDAFVEEELSLETPLDCELGATLSIPDTGGQVPGVVLVHGNGPSSRNGVVGPNRTYKELAWGLASEGIAVLRYDKRTFACQPDLADATIDNIVTEDALTAISRLRGHDRISDEQLFVAGHSFGGALAPRTARRDGDLAGIVMLAPGPAESFADLIVRQTEHILDLQPVPESRREEQLDAVRQEAEQIRTLDIGDDEVVRFGGREFYRSLQNYDQTAAAGSLDIPLLLVQGGQDWQVTVEDDLQVWENALEGKTNAEVVVYDDLNHLFQESEGQRTQAEYAQDRPVDERIVTDIASFVAETTGGTVPTLAAVSN